MATDHRGAQLHGSTVLAVGGRLLCAWFAGTHEGSNDTRVWLSWRDVSGPWSAPTPMTERSVAHWNPVLAAGPEGELWLFYKVGARISEWTTWYRRSADGETWSEPAMLVNGDVGGRGPVRNPPLLLPSGSWLAPASRELWQPSPRWEPFIDVSVDGGATWSPQLIPVERADLRGAGLIQPALWARGEHVVALMRSSEGRSYRSESGDGGWTWSTARPVSLPNGNSALAALALGDDTVACVHNPSSEDWGRRCPLVMSVSTDGGWRWRQLMVIEDGSTVPDELPEPRPARGQGSHVGLSPSDTGVRTDGIGEYSYPALQRCGDELIVTYTWQRRAIAEARVSLSAVAKNLGKDHL